MSVCRGALEELLGAIDSGAGAARIVVTAQTLKRAVRHRAGNGPGKAIRAVVRDAKRVGDAARIAAVPGECATESANLDSAPDVQVWAR